MLPHLPAFLAQDEWVDAAREEKHGRQRWLASDDGVTPSANDARPPADPEEELQQPKKPPPQGQAAVGSTIGVWWIDDAQYYFGRVLEYDRDTSETLSYLSEHSQDFLRVLTWDRAEGTGLPHEIPPLLMVH